jgi:hypothetical protein
MSPETADMGRILAAIIGAALAMTLVMSAPAASAGVPGGGKSFVGPVDDPFFVDLG